MAWPEPVEHLVDALEQLPGIGRRTAERLAFHLLRDASAGELARAIDEARARTLWCAQCGNVAERSPCAICADPKRDARTVLVVEQPRDVEAIERSGVFQGCYQVLMGAYNPAEGVEEPSLQLAGLLRRARQGELDEIILGTDPDAEGEATMLVILQALERAGAKTKVTRLARGLPAGMALEYLHRGVLEDALEGRVEVRTRKH